MRYHTTFRTDPIRKNANKLTNYVARGAEIVVDSIGQEPTERQLERFEASAAQAGETRQHSIVLTENYDPKKLAEWGKEAARDGLDNSGDWMIGIHTDNDGNNHIHIGEYYPEARGTDFDIPSFRESLEKHIDDPPSW
jgi:hypothetical protein